MENDNPSDKKAPVEIRFTPEFKRNLRALAKKYRHVQSDIQPVIEQIQAGNFVGDQVPRVAYTIFKVRVQNSDIGKGVNDQVIGLFTTSKPRRMLS